jgi:hypothetical protein
MVGQLQEILIWGNVLKLQADMAAASIAPAVSCRVMWKVALSSPCFWASFHPLSPLSVVSEK